MTSPSEKVTEACAQFQAFADTVRSDRRLSDEAKRHALAKAWVRTADKVKEIRDDYFGQAERERKNLEARLLRPPSSSFASAAEKVAADTSYRDALDRADRTENAEELTRLLSRAQRVGDDLQVRAVLATALERRDFNTLNAHVEHNPRQEEDIQNLLDLSGEASARQKLMASLHFAGPTIPPEIGARDEFAVRELAASEFASA